MYASLTQMFRSTKYSIVRFKLTMQTAISAEIPFVQTVSPCNRLNLLNGHYLFHTIVVFIVVDERLHLRVCEDDDISDSRPEAVSPNS